ncbi:outer dense fiber protein 4 [Ctenodactylus gundi]
MKDNAKQWPQGVRRSSVLPSQCGVACGSHRKVQIVASGLSLVAFILLLVMVSTEKWLHPSGSRFYQRCPAHVSNRIYSLVHVMSVGLRYMCNAGNCLSSESWQDRFQLWTEQPVFGAAEVSFILTLGLGLVLSAWLQLPYLPQLKKWPSFMLIGTIMSFCEAVLIFSTLILFPINLWIFELKKNVSIPIGWSYFIGWLVFILYFTCGVLCYYSYKKLWSQLNDPCGSVFCSGFPNPRQEPLSQISSDSSTTQESTVDS